MEEEPIRLLIADDHPVTRAGIRAILSAAPGIHVVGEAQNGQEVQTLIEQLHPRILLLDLQMPDTHPAEIERWVRAHAPETITLVLTAHDRDAYLADMMEAGATGPCYAQNSRSRPSIAPAGHRSSPSPRSASRYSVPA